MDHAFKIEDHGLERDGTVQHPFGFRTLHHLASQLHKKLIEFLQAFIKDAGKKVFLILGVLRVHHSKLSRRGQMNARKNRAVLPAQLQPRAQPARAVECGLGTRDGRERASVNEGQIKQDCDCGRYGDIDAMVPSAAACRGARPLKCHGTGLRIASASNSGRPPPEQKVR